MTDKNMILYRFRIEIPNSDARSYLALYDALRAEISVRAYCLEDAYNMIENIFLNSPFEVHPILMR